MRILGYAIVPNGEVVQALRANVADLQRRLNSTRFHVKGLEGKMARLREQQQLDRAYLEAVKSAGWAVVTGVTLSQSEIEDRIGELHAVLSGDKVARGIVTETVGVSDRDDHLMKGTKT